MILSKSTRTRILALAGWLDRRAQGLRALARRSTPKRVRNGAQTEAEKLHGL